MLQNPIYDKTVLVQVMAWYCQAQAITWTIIEPDLFRHMEILSRNELSMRIQRIKHFHWCNLAVQLTNHDVAHMPLMGSILLKLFAGYGWLNP